MHVAWWLLRPCSRTEQRSKHKSSLNLEKGMLYTGPRNRLPINLHMSQIAYALSGRLACTGKAKRCRVPNHWQQTHAWMH